MSAASAPRSTRAGENRNGDPGPVVRFLVLAPALLAGALVLRLWTLWMAAPHWPAGATIAAALGEDLLVFARGLPLLCLLSWPALRIRRARRRNAALAVLWSAWLCVPVALEQYYAVARVPLGADLFGYSWREIAATVGGGARIDAATVAGIAVPLAVLCALLPWCARWQPRWGTRTAGVVLLAACALWLCPLPSDRAAFRDPAARDLVRNKLAHFAGDSMRYWGDGVPGATAAAATSPGVPGYPFLRAEQTPDTLGAHFEKPVERPPHLVFIIVEGLGRSFSGPGAPRGSFTPFLDELADDSLYWSNFLASQGRTFGVLPSLFASLPHAEQGFAELGERMPAHAGLFNVLARQGYATRFYAGTDLDFDNARAFLRRQGVQHIVELDNFGPGYRRDAVDEWGYDDGELVARVLADGAVGGAQPTVTVIQTMTMHTPYRFAGQDAWRRRFEQRLDELQVPARRRAAYRASADIYASILFTDDALRRYFEAARQAPGYANTIFIVTGDHRLPELPMDSWIERYHVPLIVHSPLLRRPARIRAVSSHLDVAPSLLALLANRYGLLRPAQVAWTGRGLDTATEFRGTGDIPLKQHKTTLADFVAGEWFLGRGALYRLEDGLRMVPADDAEALAQVNARFERYLQANRQFVATLRLSPEGDTPALVHYRAPAPAAPAATSMPKRGVHAHDVAAPTGADAARVAVVARFTNAGGRAAEPFVPLLVLSDEQGRQVRESYAAALTLDAGATARASFDVDIAGLASGRYFIAVVPSHPDTGKRVGEGAYRIPIKIRCCAPGGGALARP